MRMLKIHDGTLHTFWDFLQQLFRARVGIKEIGINADESLQSRARRRKELAEKSVMDKIYNKDRGLYISFIVQISTLEC